MSNPNDPRTTVIHALIELIISKRPSTRRGWASLLLAVLALLGYLASLLLSSGCVTSGRVDASWDVTMQPVYPAATTRPAD
ncbi:MAG: hypothetical protein PVJ57_23120 [Phycisphaerae bacterium]|jgi:hypothetical protein